VSSRTCKACHPSQYETWFGSFHRTMTQVATPDTARADFDGTRVASVHGRPMLLERRERELWAEFDDPDWGGRGDQRPRIRRQIVMITGSHHQQAYWYRTDRNRLLGQLPGMYVIAERRWLPRAAAFLQPPTEWPASETGRWNAVCVNCHATHGKRGFSTPFGSEPVERQVVDTTVAEFGVACESCHGPSQRHVRINRSPIRRYSSHLGNRRDPTIIQPALLDPKLSSQVCGQCHGVWNVYDQAGERQANAAGLPYRPGDDLSRTRFIVQPTKNIDSPTMKRLVAEHPGFLRESFWADGMIRVSGREYNGLIDSPCFKDATDAKRTMSCFSCHAMHKTPADPRSISQWADTYQVSPGMDGDQACLQCHAAFLPNLTAHTKHRADSTGTKCYNCHMPYTSYGLLKALRSHQVSSPTVTASLQTGRPNACNLCHLDKTLGWTSARLQEWYGTPSVPLGEDERTIAASLLWLLRGDAGQRALMAWSMGWQPAQQASGTTWMPLYLAELMTDQYDAVRFIAYRSLRSLPGFGELQYDFFATPEQRFAASVEVLQTWRRTLRGGDRRTDGVLLLDAQGSPKLDVFNRLIRQRTNRHVLLRE
jgi:Zn-finger protein